MCYEGGCNGNGTGWRRSKQNVNITTVANTGTVVRGPEVGHVKGDLLVRLRVTPHSYFKRDGYNIHTEKLITISQAVLGYTTDIATLYGKKSVVIKPGTSSGTILIIPKYGVTKMYPNQYSKGDHYVHLTIKIPSYLDKRQSEAMKAYAALEDPIIQDDPKIWIIPYFLFV